MTKSLLLMLILCLTAAANNVNRQGDPLLNSCRQYKQVDAEMNRLYQQVLKEHSLDRLLIKKMQTAQRAWLAFRDAHVESIYPAANKRAAYGNVYSECSCLAMIEVTTRRTMELTRWIQGTKEGDVCAGSVKIRR